MEYRITVDEAHRFVLPEELLNVLSIDSHTVLLCRVENTTLIIDMPKQKEIDFDRVEYDMIEAGLFWLPVEIAYFKDQVRVRCKDPMLEAWDKSKESAIVRFKEKAGSHKNPSLNNCEEGEDARL